MLKKIFDSENRSPELLRKAESGYKFQKELTNELDNNQNDFDEVTFLKIVLWKTNRYPILRPDTIQIINNLRSNYSVTNAQNALAHLLELKGFDLPMASTVLRFACPDKFQIIDKRVYRFIMPTDTLKIPFSKAKKVEMYFEYIERLKSLCLEYSIPFEKADRILYQLDKDLNSNISIDY